MTSQPLTNWARNIVFEPASVARPRSRVELAEVLASASSVRVLGTGHSFSPVCSTDGTLLSLADLPVSIDVDVDALRATVGGPLRWGDIAPVLDGHGVALHNMGSLPHISVAGSASTGTHGSGSALGCLATAVCGVELMTADGSVRWIREGDDGFYGSVVALGMLGAVLSVELAVEPAYDVEQTVWQGLPFVVAVDRFDDVMGSARSVSLFTTWQADEFEQVWVKRDTASPPADLGWTGATPSDVPLHPCPGISPEACTQQLGVVGRWYERVPHFRLDHTPSSGDELQSEYLLDRSCAAEALEAVQTVAHVVAPVLQISEIRTVAADSLWLSPCYGRDSVAVHFTWIDDADAVAPAVAAVESVLVPLGARPHWGKVFDVEPGLVASAYPRLADQRALRNRLDPERRFTNGFVARYLDA